MKLILFLALAGLAHGQTLNSGSSVLNDAVNSKAPIANPTFTGNVTIGATVPSNAPPASLSVSGNVYAGTLPVATFRSGWGAPTGNTDAQLYLDQASGTIYFQSSGLWAPMSTATPVYGWYVDPHWRTRLGC